MSDSNHLLSKQVNILITNICNLSCGGCSQQCGYIPKDKLWNIPLEQLKWNIDLLIDCRSGDPGKLGLFGGEPTLHPEFDEILKILLKYPNVDFEIFTNGREFGSKRTQNKKNIRFRLDMKDKNSCKVFAPNQIAAKDVLGIENKRFYWDRAKRNCHMWKNCCCIIYNNKAYFCEAPAAWDLMTDQDHGWPLKWGEDPFLKTNKQIAEQADNFCYRCGWCLTKEELKKAEIPRQLINAVTLSTKTNINLNTKKPMKLIQSRREKKRSIKLL